MKVSKMKQGKNVENGKSTFTQKWRNRKTDLRKNVEILFSKHLIFSL